MKTVITISLIFLLTSGISSQTIVRDKYGDIKPLSSLNEINQKIDWGQVKKIQVKDFNNDSLCYALNGKHLWEMGSQGYGSKRIDLAFKFKTKAKKIDLQNGSLYLLIIKSNNAPQLTLEFDKMQIPPGSYFSYRENKNINTFTDYNTLTKDNIYKNKKGNVLTTVSSNTIILEYYEPYEHSIGEIHVSGLYYDFIAPGYKNLYGKKGNYKSGEWGTATCPQTDVACYEVDYLQNAAKSVCYIEVWNSAGNKIARGTGFFLNKSGGYSLTDNAIIFTAGHLFFLKDTQEDLWANWSKIIVRVNYQNQTCDDENNYTGFLIQNVEPIEIGNSYNIDVNDNNYNASQDYAILKTKKEVEWLNALDIRYAGWNSNSMDPYLKQYHSMGHPGGDVKKLLIDYGNANINSNGKEFGLYFDVGINEPGFSGAPIFNRRNQVVGWNCSSWINEYCQSNVRSECGMLKNVYDCSTTLYNEIDPYFMGETNISETIIFPEYCTDCEKNGDETEIDCGGSCPPCKDTEEIEIISDQDLLKGGYLFAKQKIEIKPVQNLKSTGTILNIPSNSFLRAGEKIIINNGTKIYKNSDLYLDSDLILNAPERGCTGRGCINAYNCFSPNGEGLNEQYGFYGTNIVKYHAYIFGLDCKEIDGPWWQSYKDKVFLDVKDVPVTENGIVYVWDGESANNYVCAGSPTTFYAEFTFFDCTGYSWTEQTLIGRFKSGKDKTIINISETKTDQLLLFPNPADEILNIAYINDSSSDFSYHIYNNYGKIILSDCINKYGTINIKDLSPGVYYLEIIDKEEKIIKKFIKN